MKRHLLYGFIFLVASGLMLSTCNKDYFDLNRLSDEIELQPALVAPLIYGTMNLGDLVEMYDSTNVSHEFDDGLIYLAYNEGYSVMADTIFEIPDKLMTKNFIDSDINIPIWQGSAIGDTVPFFKSELFTNGLDGNDRVDSILIKGGEIIIDVASSFEHTGLLTISSSQIRNVDRDTFTTVFVINDLSGNFTDQQIFLSDGYFIEPKEVNDTSYVQINYRLDLINSGNPINPDDVCDIRTSFIDMGFYSVFGLIDSRDLITENGLFEIPLYTDNPDLASIIFNDPRIRIFASNSVGIPVEVEVDSIIATSSRDGSKLELNFNEGNTFLIGAPALDQMGERVNTEINVDKTSSNIDELVASAPSDISYKIISRTLAGTEEDKHFVLDTSILDVSLEFLLPLDLKSSSFALRDTLDFELAEDGIDTSLVEFAELSVNSLNELPVELELQVYLLDSLYAVIDSIFDAYTIILGASVVDDDGNLSQATEESNKVTFTAEKLGKLQDVRFIHLEARMITSELGDKFVKFYSDYSLDFKISMFANLRINNRDL